MTGNATSKQDQPIRIGTAEATAGELVYGWFEVAELPTGGVERLPVMIAQGQLPGPVFWLTGNIHGNELTGMAAIHDAIKPEIVENLRGTVIAIPSLNPAGLRVGQREPYIDPNDPNRTFPGYVPSHADPEDEERAQKTPTIYEAAMGRLFEQIRATADFLIDLHCYSLQSTSFTIRDRVLYHDESEQADSEELYRRTDEMGQAFGLPIVNEALARQYVDSKLHRSTSGAALNEGRIPAFTVELGLSGGIDPRALEAGTTGILNALKWAGMLPGDPQQITSVPAPKPDFNTRRESQPRAHQSGIIRYRVQPGDLISKGQVIAILTDIFGRTLSDGEIHSPEDGWVISLNLGAICYQGQVVTNLALRDDGPMVEPFPS